MLREEPCKQLSHCINSLTKASETVFLKFGTTVPLFVQEMHNSLELSGRSAKTLGAGNTIEEILSTVFSGVQNTLQGSSDNFEGMHQRDSAFLESLNKGIHTLSSLDELIFRIRDDSTEMELISLNAMTVALKAGVNGRAFSVITDELKRLSTQTILLTEQLTSEGRHLLELFKKYQQDLQILEQRQTDLFEGLDQRLRGNFETLGRSVREVANGLYSLAESSKGIQEPVSRVMETVQVQDIIRQSLDHVLLALTELDKESGDTAKEDLFFRSKLLELALSIMDEVKLVLEKARSRLHTETNRLREVVKTGEKQRRDLMQSSLGMHAAGSGGFDALAQELRQLDIRVKEYLKSKNHIQNNGAKLGITVSSLEKRFLAFVKIVNRFKVIDIASRIEVAKTDFLFNMGDTVREMSRLTERIGLDVGQALDVTKVFLADTQEALSAFEENSEDEQLMIGNAESAMARSLEDLAALRENMTEGVRSFRLYTPEFIQLVEDSRNENSLMDELCVQSEKCVTLLRDLHDKTQQSISKAGLEYQDDEVRSTRLKNIIEQFTIYAHKRTAGELAGFAVESAAETGDITFF